jgi:hypothetical protein
VAKARLSGFFLQLLGPLRLRLLQGRVHLPHKLELRLLRLQRSSAG